MAQKMVSRDTLEETGTYIADAAARRKFEGVPQRPANPLFGKCAIVTESIYIALGRPDNLQPVKLDLMNHPAGTEQHWCLTHDGRIYDPTRQQFPEGMNLPYADGELYEVYRPSPKCINFLQDLGYREPTSRTGTAWLGYATTGLAVLIGGMFVMA